MALTFKTKAKTTAIEVPNDTDTLTTPQDIAELIDAAEMLRSGAEAAAKKIAVLAATVKAYKEAQSVLAEALTVLADERGLARDQKFTEFGQLAGVEVSKKTMARAIKDQKLAMSLLGEDVYFAKASVPLGVIDEYLNGTEKDKLLNTTYGVRGIKLVPKAKAPKLKGA